MTNKIYNNPFNYLLDKDSATKTAASLFGSIGSGGYTANDAFIDATSYLNPTQYGEFLQSPSAKSLLGYDLYEEDPDRALRIAEDTAFTAFGDRNLPKGMIERYTQAARDAGRTGSPGEMRQFIAQSLAADPSYSEPRTVNEYDRRNAGLMGNIMFNKDGTKSGRFDVGEGIGLSYNKLKEDNLAGKYAQLLG